MSEETKQAGVIASEDCVEIEAGTPETLNLTEKTLAELTEILENFMSDPDRMRKHKEAEAIKSAFYKRLSKERAASNAVGVDGESEPFDALENGFKALFGDYKKQKAEYNIQLEKEREANLTAKQAVIESLKLLVEKQEDVNATFPEFREIQSRWREIGPVPVANYRDLNETYQFYVEKFYDMVKINRDLRDLDLKKNLEIKTGYCEEAERLIEKENIASAFKELQKLHELWKECGPVAKEYREEIWARFKEATSALSKKHQAYYENEKAKQEENLEKKTEFCEQVEHLLEAEHSSIKEWGNASKEVLEIQKQWRAIGFATKKENQKIYDRFREACNKFFEKKKEFFSKVKSNINENYDKKLALVEKAEALKDSIEWVKTSEILIACQKEWKEIGPVARKKTEELWKRFHNACDEFFKARESASKHNSPHREGKNKHIVSEKSLLMQKYNKLQQEITNYENNIGFFAASKNSEPLIRQMQEKIDAAKVELKEMESKIRNAE